MKTPRRAAICATSIAVFLAQTPDVPGNSYTVNLGDTQVEAGLVSGATGLSKTGGGTLVLANAGNSYTGVTTISNGSVVISNPAALGASSSAIVVTGFNPMIGQATNVRGFGGGSLVLNGLLGGMNLTRDLSLQGQGPIADRGGALISLGSNTVSGAITTGNLAFGLTPINTTLISSGGTLTLAGGLNVGGVAGTTVTTLGGANQGGVAHYDLTGPLTGAGTLAKSGGGTLFLNPSDSSGFSGSIRTGGFLASGQNSIRIATPNVLGTRTATGTNSVLDLNGGSLEVLMDAPSVLAGGAPANVYARATSMIFVDKGVGSLATNGTVTFGELAHTGALGASTILTSRNGFGMSFGATPVQVVTGNSAFTNNVQGGLLSFTGNFWSNPDTTGSRTFALQGNGNTLIDGNIVASAAGPFDHNFTKTGIGTLTVTGTGSTLDGNFNIQGGTVATRRIVGGLLGVAPSTAVGALTLGTSFTPGTLTYLGAAGTGAGETLSRPVALAGITAGGRINASQAGSAPSPLVINGPITTSTGTKTLTLGGASPLDNEVQSAIPNPALQNLSLQKTDSGVWVLSGSNTYAGSTTISNGTLKLKATSALSTVLNDASPIVFNADANQAAGGRLQFTGFPFFATNESVGVLTPQQGHGTVSVANGGGQTTLAFAGIAPDSNAASVNFEAPTVLDVVTIAGTAGFVGGSRYFNGSHYAYSDAGGVLRAPVYDSDIGFVSSPAGFSPGFHSNVTGSFASGAASVASLRINGSQTLSLFGPLIVGPVAGSVGGVLLSGGVAAINNAGGGSMLIGGTSNAGLVFRVDQAADVLTLGVPLTGSVAQAIAKNGLGTLVLAAANAQAGATHINQGTVRLAPGGRLSGANQALLIRQEGTLDLNGITQPANTISAFNGAGRVTNGSATPVEFSVGNNAQGGAFTGVIEDGVGRVSVTKQSTGTLTLSGANTYTGATTIASTGTLTVTNLADIGQPSALGIGDATSGATNADSLVFTGAQTVSAATGLSLPGALNYAGAAQISTDRLFRLGGVGAGAGARITASGIQNAGVVFANTAPIAYTAAGATAAQNLVLGGPSTNDNRIDLQLVNSGVAGGSLRVNKIDAGKWVLGNPANSYTGATKINGGVLEAHHGTSLPTTSALLFGGTLAIPTGGVLETSGVFTRALSVGTVANTVNFNANGNFAGSGGFAASGDKLTVNLGGAFAPLAWGAGGFLMPGTAAATLRLSSATALGEVDFQNPINLGSVSRTIQVDDNGNIGTDFATLSGALSGNGAALSKAGGGTLRLSGANTYTGTTTVTAGTLIVQSLGSSSTPGPTSVGDSTAGNTDSGALLLGNGGTTGAILQYVGPGETSDRKIRLNTTVATTQIHADGSGPLILTNVNNDVASGAKNLALRGTNASGNRIDGVLYDSNVFIPGPLSVSVDGSAMWILNAANTYTGNTNSLGGALGLGDDFALGPAGTLVMSTGNLFAHGGDRTIANPVQFSPSGVPGFLGEHSLTFTQPLTLLATANAGGINNNLAAGEALTFAGMTANFLTANRTFTVDGPGETIFNGAIAGSGTSAFGLSIVKTGTGMLRLDSGGSNFTRNGANLEIDNGVVRLGAANAIPSGPGFGGVVFSPDDGQAETATLNLNGFSQTINSLAGANSSASLIDNVSGAAVTLTIGANDGAVNSNAAIANSGGGALTLVKSGTAAAVLSGTSFAYTGATTVQTGGSLAFTGADPTTTTAINVGGNAGLRLIQGIGSSYSSLATLNLGAPASTIALGLDVGTITDTLSIPGPAATAGTVLFSIGAAPGFGAFPKTLLQAGSGLSGATYEVSGFVPGGYTYSLTASDTSVILNGAPASAENFFWTGDQNRSWSAYHSGNTNWEDAVGTDTASTPGPLNAVVFSSPINSPGTDTFITTLDQPVAIDSLRFNGFTASTLATRVAIAPGLGANTLTIAPANSLNGIDVPDNADIASITAPVVLAADQTWNVGSVGTQRPDLTVTGVLSGAGNLTKVGSGTATITGTNTRTGRTAILGGTLRINAEAALGANPSAFAPTQLLLDGGTLRNTATLTIDDANRGITIGPLGGAFDTPGGAIVTVAATNVIAGPGTLRKEGTSALRLLGANTYLGGTFINAGFVRAGHSSALGSGTLTLGNSGVVLELADGVNVANAAIVSNTGNDKYIRLIAGATAATYSGNITVFETNSFPIFRVQASVGGTLTISGDISGATSGGIEVNGFPTAQPGTVVFAGANTYAGLTEVLGGTLRNSANEVIPGALSVSARGTGNLTATYDISEYDETISALSFSVPADASVVVPLNVVTGTTGTLFLNGDVTTSGSNPNARAEIHANVVLADPRTFSVADAANTAVDLVVAGILTGPGAITKTGLGTMKIRGQALYSGVTTVNAGVLLVEGSISGAVSVAGGTLGGTGSVGPIGASGGAISPGESIGTLTATSLTMNATSTFRLEIDTTNQTIDLLNTSGPLGLSLSGTPLSIADLGANFALAQGARFPFLTYSGGRTGLFSVGGNAIDDDLEHFAVGANIFAIDYNDLGGTAVSLVVVPEPGVAGSLLAGAGLLAGLRRRRRRDAAI